MSGDGDLFLGVDVGTQSTKAVLVDVDSGSVVARAARSYDLIGGLPAGHAEQHPGTWTEAVIAAVREVSLGLGPRIRGVGVSGQQHGAVLLGAGDEVLRPAKLWCDTSAAEEAAALSAELGRAIPAGFTAPKLRWSAEREPAVWARVQRVLLPHDYINLFLTGEFFTEVGDASGTGYLDPASGSYDAEAVERSAPGLADLLPPLRSCAAPAGELSDAAAAALGLEAGTPVSAGGGDNMMSAIGAGATRPGVSVCSLGTSATVFAFAAEPAVDPGGDIASFRASSAGDEGVAGHLPLLCVMNCTEPLEDLRALTGKGHDELTELARTASMGEELLVPFFMGERVPNLPDATATLSGLRPGSLSPGILYRAALEGVALNLASGVERMRRMGIEPEEVRLVGGAARNPLWQEILATTFGVPVRVLVETETAAVGAALQVAAAVRDEPVDRIAQGFVAYGGAAVEPSADGETVERLARLAGRLAGAVAAQRTP